MDTLSYFPMRRHTSLPSHSQHNPLAKECLKNLFLSNELGKMDAFSIVKKQHKVEIHPPTLPSQCGNPCPTCPCQDGPDSARNNNNAATSVQKQKARSCSKKELS